MNNALSLFVLVACAGLLGAQTQSAEAPASRSFHDAHGVVRDDAGVPWLLGPDYKASVVAGAMSFVPALGRAAPCSMPLTFRLQTIALGATALHEAGTTGAAPTIDGNRVTLAHGELLERYDATVQGVEQSFVVPSRPIGEGDLIVRGSLTTALQPIANHDGSLDFTDGRVGGVRIGRVVGIDATGACCDGSLSFANGQLELRLPAAFVAAAAYPLTVDPLFGTALLPGSTGNDDGEVDTAYDETFGVYLVAWSRSFSATDQDLRAQRIGNDGSFVGSVISITNSTTSEIRPVVASINQRNRFVVAWQSAPSPFGPWTVMARSVAADTGTMATAATVGPGLSPAICGDRSQSGSTATVVYHLANVAIVACTVNVDAAGALTIGTSHTLGSLFADLVSGPKVAKSNEPNGLTVATWEAGFGSGHIITARAVNYSAFGVGNGIYATSSGINNKDHAIDGDGQQFVLAYRDTAMNCMRLEWNGTALVVANSTQLLGTIGARAPAVGWLGDRYLVAFEQPLANPFEAVVRARVIDANCEACGLYFQVPAVGAASQRRPAIATHWAASSSLQDALLAWDETANTAPFLGNVAAQRFTRMVGAPPVVLSPSCSGGGSSGINGPFALGNQGFHMTLTGGDPSAPIALLGLTVGNPAPVVCGCSFSQASVYYAMLAIGGSADFAFPVPCNPTLLGFELEFQWLLYGAAASPCPFVPGIIASDRVRLTIAE